MKRTPIIPIKWINEQHDTDGDGVPNYRDCNIWNPHRQHLFEFGKKKQQMREALFDEKIKEEEVTERKIKSMKKSHPGWKSGDFICLRKGCGRSNAELIRKYEWQTYHRSSDGVMVDPPNLKCRACGGRLGYAFYDKKGAQYTIDGKMYIPAPK